MNYDRIEISEGTDINKTDGLQECIISNYLCFLAINVRFQPKVCYGCHDMTLKLMNFDSFAIVTVWKNDYRILFWFMCKDEAVNKLNNTNLSEKSGQLWL